MKKKYIHDLPLPHISYGRTTCTLQGKERKKNALNVIIEVLNPKFNIQSFTLTVPIHTTKVLCKDNLICVLQDRCK